MLNICAEYIPLSDICLYMDEYLTGLGCIYVTDGEFVDLELNTGEREGIDLVLVSLGSGDNSVDEIVYCLENSTGRHNMVIINMQKNLKQFTRSGYQYNEGVNTAKAWKGIN